MPKDFLALDTNFPSFTGTETTEQKVDQLYNYTYMLLENLRYTLRNLDESNFNEAGLGEILEPVNERVDSAENEISKIKEDEDGIYLRLTNAEGDITNLQITAEGLGLQISNAEGDINSLQLTAEGLAAQIQNAEGDITQLQLTAQGLAAQISSAEGDITQLQLTAQGLAAQISSAEGDIASLQLTAEGLAAQISSAEGDIASLQLTAEGLAAQISSAEGDIANLQLTAEGLAAQIATAEGDITTLQATAEGLAAQISSAEGDIASLQLAAQGLSTQIVSAEGEIASLQLTAQGLSTQIANAEGEIASLQLTASGLQSQIGSVSGEVTSLQQTVNSFTISASNGDTKSTLRLYAGGVMLSSAVIAFSGVVLFTDLDGSSGTIIDGGAIDTDTLYLDSLYGNYIYLYDNRERSGARFEITGASSYSGGALNILSGAIGLYALGGDLYLSSDTGYVTLSGSDATCMSDFYPSSDDRYDLGVPSFVWSNVYASSGVVNTSDREKKESIVYGLYKLDGLLDKLEPCTFRFINGTSGRTHAGFIAQDVETAMEELGLTSMDFAGLIKSPRKDENGEETGAYDYGLRYTEFIPINTWEIQKLKARVTELEKRLEALEGGDNG